MVLLTSRAQAVGQGGGLNQLGSGFVPLTWSGLLFWGQLSQTSPTPSPSLSFWSELDTLGQLSTAFRIPAGFRGTEQDPKIGAGLD